MRIGMDTGVTSRIDGALAGINYEYTWAWDASKQTSVSDVAGYDTFNSTIVDDGININYNASDSAGLVFQEADFTAGSISGGSGTQVIPDGSVSQTVGGAVSHPGRYFSTVATIHDLTVADGTLNAGELFGITITGAGSVVNIAILGSDPSHINGNFRFGVPGVVYNPGTDGGASDPNGDLAMAQAEINSILGRPIAVTYDLSVGFYAGMSSDDPSTLTLYPAYGESIDMNATIHGFIISNRPPRIYHTPIPIGSPSI